jgi:hypothetical protein
MASAGKVIELVGMETEGAVGGKVQGNDAYRGSPIEQHGGAAGMLLAGQRVQAERPRPAG